MTYNGKHLQLLLKKLRKRISPHKIRYFECGAYGTKLQRPHYHLLLS
ncbi:nonstructural protein [Chlamydia pneumoniae B21]|nr:nonstructural protein [Chlamydia pneumoniae B21]